MSKEAWISEAHCHRRPYHGNLLRIKMDVPRVHPVADLNVASAYVLTEVAYCTRNVMLLLLLNSECYVMLCNPHTLVLLFAAPFLVPPRWGVAMVAWIIQPPIPHHTRRDKP